MKIAILGATGYIGKSLVNEFLQDENFEVSLFVRSRSKLEKFIEDLKSKNKKILNNYHIEDIDNFLVGKYEVIVNCIGISDPKILKERPEEIITLTEKFDNLVLKYLESNRATKYINLSSGAAYGKNASQAVNENTPSIIDINNIKEANLYSIAKIHSEAKHRSLKNLQIIDLRVFAFFSQFVDLSAGFLMSEIAQCLVEGKVFKTTSVDIVRDFIGPEDLFNIVLHVIKFENVNDVFDVVSHAPITKLELINFLKEKYNLKVEITDQFQSQSAGQSPTGNKNTYCSTSEKLKNTGFEAKYNSIECIDGELEKMLTI